ncbi:MAG: hypothetical protein MJZ66_10225 [Bacteroidales bacterium]|nr:hypothetical protein [Bacteroidales bacterium]
MPENVFGIKCEACGSPLSFDIIKQNYKCEACGCVSPVERVTQKLRDDSQKRSENQRLTLENKPRSIFQCTSCGARIFVPEGEALAKCDFCETSALKSDFADMDFPEGIIPFYITRDEAIDIFRKWVEENSSPKKAAIFLNRISELQGYYLPHKMLRGPVDMGVGFKLESRYLPMLGYLDGIFVSESKDLNNLVLDGAEPFDIRYLVPFDLKYMAGHKAKLPDIDDEELKRRTFQEACSYYAGVVKKILWTPSPQMCANSARLSSVPVYLPMYILKIGIRLLAINGQTGRVSMLASSNSLGAQFGRVKGKRSFFKRDNYALVKENRFIQEYKPLPPLFSTEWKITDSNKLCRLRILPLRRILASLGHWAAHILTYSVIIKNFLIKDDIPLSDIIVSIAKTSCFLAPFAFFLILFIFRQFPAIFIVDGDGNETFRRQNLLGCLKNGFWEEGSAVIILFVILAHLVILPVIYTGLLK